MIVRILASLVASAILLAGACHAQPTGGWLDINFANGDGVFFPNYSFVSGGSTGDTASAVAQDSSGRIYVVGYFRRTGTGNIDCGVLRTLANAQMYDTSFAAPLGFRTLAPDLGGARQDYCNDIVVLPDGSSLIAGSSSIDDAFRNTGTVIRLDPNGGVDSSFFNDGILDTWFDLQFAQLNKSAQFSTMFIDRQGRIVIAGNSVVPNAAYTSYAIALRLLPDGSLDADFGNNGVIEFADFNPPTLFISGIAEDAQGRLLFSGYSRSAFPPDDVGVLFRRLSDGSADTSFGAGMSVLGGGGRGFVPRCAYLNDLRIDAQQRMVLACGPDSSASGERPGVLRLLPNGLADQNFGNGGLAQVAFATAGNLPVGRTNYLTQSLPLADGTIIAVGEHANFNQAFIDYGSSDIGVARLLPNGSPDPSFGVNNGATLWRFGALDGLSERPAGTFIQADGNVLVVGSRSRPAAGTDGAEFVVMRVFNSIGDELFANGFE